MGRKQLQQPNQEAELHGEGRHAGWLRVFDFEVPRANVLNHHGVRLGSIRRGFVGVGVVRRGPALALVAPMVDLITVVLGLRLARFGCSLAPTVGSLDCLRVA